MNVPAKQLKKQRLELILLFALPIIGTLLMTAYYFYATDNQTDMGTHNKGILVSPPKPMSELSLLSEGKPFKLSDGSGKWTFLVLGSNSCDETCVEKLYLTRQIKEALGKYKLRIRNVYLMKTSSDNAQSDEPLAALSSGEYSGHEWLSVDGGAFNDWSQQEQPHLQSLPDVQFYVVDPAGWLMMYYSTEHSYKQVISDMKFLIKNS